MQFIEDLDFKKLSFFKILYEQLDFFTNKIKETLEGN